MTDTTRERLIEEMRAKVRAAVESTTDTNMHISWKQIEDIVLAYGDAREAAARAEERKRIKKALRKEYEDTFHWGKDEIFGTYVFGTYITEKEFWAVIKAALTPEDYPANP